MAISQANAQRGSIYTGFDKDQTVDRTPIERRSDRKASGFESGKASLFTRLRSWPTCFHRGSDAASGTKHATDHRRFGTRGADYVFEHAVHDVFLEDAQVAVVRQVFLERLQLQAELVGDVADLEHA